jgi:DNA-binding response OmpR family regulator
MAASILVVDDDESIRELLRLHLSSAGYEVRVAEDAIEAGHMVLASAPDLIIMDVLMPYIPVIFVTQVEDGEYRGRELGAVGYLTKPVRADQVLALVAQHVPSGAGPIG